MIILDTNVLSECLRPEPDTKVTRWLESQPPYSVFTTTIVEGEILYGVELLPDGKRRKQYLDAVKKIFAETFADRILSFDRESATVFAELAAHRKRSGNPISQFDAMIAAIAKSRGASLATRNTKDFINCGIELIDPWQPKKRRKS